MSLTYNLLLCGSGPFVGLTNNEVPYGEDLKGVGLYYGMQGAKVGWISDETFDPQVLADIQRLARQDETDQVLDLVTDRVDRVEHRVAVVEAGVR